MDLEIMEINMSETTLSIDGIVYGDFTEKNKVILRRGEEICTLRKDIDEMNDVIRDSREDNEMLSDMCDELQDENDEYIEGFFAMKREIRELEGKNRQLSLTLDEVECENEILSDENETLDRALCVMEDAVMASFSANKILKSHRVGNPF